MKIFKINKLLLVASLLVANTATAITKDELQSIGNRMRGVAGSLLNIPTMPKSKEILGYEQKVRDILLQLQPELFQKYQLSISIYSSSSPNAFMESVSAKTIKGYKLENVYKELYHFDVNQPIFNLGITLGLFKLTTTRDELAFVLGHELTHLFENHIDQSISRGDRWLSSQQFEAIADHKSIEMMLGKFDIRAATTALWKLAELDKTKDNLDETGKAIDAITKTTSDHHDPSVRISMAQSYVAYLQNSQLKAQPTPQQILTKKEIVKHSPRLITKNIYSEASTEQFNRLFNLIYSIIESNIETDNVINLDQMVIIRRKVTIEDLDSVKYLNLINNREILPFYATSPEATQKYIDLTLQKILNHPTWSIEQKLAGIYSTFQLYYNYLTIHGGEIYDSFLRYFEKTVSLLVKKQSINWDQFIRFSIFKAVGNPELFFYNSDLFTEVYFLPSVQKMSSESLSRLLKLKQDETLSLNNLNIDQLLTELNLIAFKENKQNISLSSEYLLLRKKQQIFNLIVSQLFNKTSKDEIAIYMQNDIGKSQKLIRFVQGYQYMRDSNLIIPISFCENLLELNKTITLEYLKQRQLFLNNLTKQSSIDEKQLDQLGLIFGFTEKEYSLTPGEIQLLKNIFSSLLTKQFQLHEHDQLTKYNNILNKMLDTLVKIKILPISNQTELDKKLYFELLRLFIDKKTSGDLTANEFQFLQEINQKYQLVDLLAAKKFIEKNDLQSRLDDYVNSNEMKNNVEAFLQFIEVNKLNPHENIVKQLMSSNYPFGLFLDYSNLNDMLYLKIDYYFSRIFAQEFNFLLNANADYQDAQMKKYLSSQQMKNVISRIYSIIQLKQQYYKKYLPVQSVSDIKIRTQQLSARDFEQIDMITQSLFDLFYSIQQSMTDLNEWAKLLRSIAHLSNIATESRAEYKEGLEQKFLELSKNGTDPRAYQWIFHPQLKQFFSRTAFNLVLMAEFQRQISPNPTSKQIRELFEKIDSERALKAKMPDVFDDLRKSIAETFHLQPNTIQEIFPDSDLIINTKTTSEFKNEIRGLSGFAAYMRLRPIQDQIEFIEYVMGHQNQMPQFIIKAKEEKNLPIDSVVLDAKNKLSRSNEIARAFFVNSILTGPNAAMAKPDQQKAIVEYLLRNVSNKSIALELADAMITSLEKDRSLFVAYIFAQKTEPGKTLTEGEILRSLFEAFGAPGIKLGQYLAFTGEMGPYQNDLALLQDSALPISYLDLLGLLVNKLGMDWSNQWEVVRLLGSGSVNVAVEVKSRTTNETRVISILRQDIQASAKNNFRLLRLFADELVKRQAPGVHKYDFLPGLLNLNEKSVSLEFDKQNAKTMQDHATLIYPRQVMDWKIQVPKAFEILNDAVSMQKANGKTARKIRQTNFQVYQEVMGIVLNLEFDHLMNSNVFTFRPLPTFANPDMHDGQVLIDIDNKTINILDFGQAVSINKEERDLGLHLLRVLAMTDKKDLQKQIKVLKDLTFGKSDFSEHEMQMLLQKTEMMDRFIYLIGISENHNWKLPLSTIHFVLAINRVMKLGDNIGYNITPRLKTIITTRALTKSTELGYYLSELIESAQKASARLKNSWQKMTAPRCESVFASEQ